MHDLNNLGPRIINYIGGIGITETVYFGIIVAVVLIIFCVLSTRNLKDEPKGLQAVAELIVETVYNMVGNTMGKDKLGFAPYIGTLFLFLILGNMLGLFGLRPTTSDVNMTFALALLTFILIQANSIRSKGLVGYFKHFAEPYPFLIPTNIIEEISFPISLGFRLFGNILAGVIVMALAFNGLGYLSHELLHSNIPWLEAVIPLPLNAFFDIFEPIVQAFIFTMLTMVFITKAMITHDKSH